MRPIQNLHLYQNLMIIRLVVALCDDVEVYFKQLDIQGKKDKKLKKTITGPALIVLGTFQEFV